MNSKQLVSIKATEFIKNNMIIGLGTGTTIKYFLKEIKKKIIKENLNIKCISSSKKTSQYAKKLNLPLININKIKNIDLTIDGADKVDYNLNGIKGGGGALLQEKILAFNSKQNIWIIHEKKFINFLGNFNLPIEIIPFAYKHLLNFFLKKKILTTLRFNKNKKPFKTDNNNYILDLHFKKILNPIKLSNFLNKIPGIVENGLFINIVDKVIIGNNKKSKIIKRII